MTIKPIREFGQQLTNIEVVNLIKGELTINDVPSYKEAKEQYFSHFDGVPEILSYSRAIDSAFMQVAWYVAFDENGEQDG